jgi:NAD(P) transhydrogenase subunit alpha
VTIHVRMRAERSPGEKRVAATPDSIKKLLAAGATVDVESGAGSGSLITDAAYEAAGARIVARDQPFAPGVLFHVRPLTAPEIEALPAGTITVGTIDPFQNAAAVTAARDAGVTSFALDLLPRISRAQSMDVLSSQALLAGYRLVTIAADAFGRMFGMTMTAAGTLAPARVLVLGAGVAGLQAIATAKRLGGVVTGFDVRSVVKEQVQSLGGRFLEVEAVKDAEGEGGYARPLTDEENERLRAELGEAAKRQDVIITTAQIPGRPAPRLITADAIKEMASGSVIVDLAAETGGNVEGSVPGKTVEQDGVRIIGPANLPSQMAGNASALYAKNLQNLVELLVDDEGNLAIDTDDEIVAGACLTRDGEIVNERAKEAASQS